MAIHAVAVVLNGNSTRHVVELNSDLRGRVSIGRVSPCAGVDCIEDGFAERGVLVAIEAIAGQEFQDAGRVKTEPRRPRLIFNG